MIEFIKIVNHYGPLPPEDLDEFVTEGTLLPGMVFLKSSLCTGF